MHVCELITGRSSADSDDSAAVVGKDAAGRSGPKQRGAAATAAGRTGFAVLRQSGRCMQCSAMHMQA